MSAQDAFDRLVAKVKPDLYIRLRAKVGTKEGEAAKAEIDTWLAMPFATVADKDAKFNRGREILRIAELAYVRRDNRRDNRRDTADYAHETGLKTGAKGNLVRKPNSASKRHHGASKGLKPGGAKKRGRKGKKQK